MTAKAVATAPTPPGRRTVTEGLRERIELIVTPVFFLLLVAAIGLVWIYGDLDVTAQRIVNWPRMQTRIIEHINLTFWSTLLVVSIAIPLGIFITRPAFRRFAPPILGLANAGQAAPAYGILILFAGFFGTGARTAIYALLVVALLPVLRNTMVGLQQVDQSIIEAGRGMGLSKRQALTRIELPLAVPIILAGIRTALVINVGTAALVGLIGAGGIGLSIISALQLRRDNAAFIAAALVAALALLIDFLAALAERYLRPKGI
jgi:osmoprotectant transport system permease protein